MVQAYQLGKPHPVIDQLIHQGLIKPIDETHFEVFSQESRTKGEIATIGDYIKCDHSNHPYPNNIDYFLSHFDHIKDDTYQTKPVIMDAWDYHEPPCQEIDFLIHHKGLTIHQDQDDYYSAPLRGTTEYAKKDSVIVFYHIERSGTSIKDIDFNFVARDEFVRLYEIVNA